MLTKDEIDFLYSCSDTKMMEEIIRRETRIPGILITISDGCYQNSISSDPVTLIIEDKDHIEQGGELFYTELGCTTETDFNNALHKAERDVIIHGIIHRGYPIINARIFIHDKEDEFPFNVMVSQEVVATFRTFTEAAAFLAEIGEAIKNDR